MAFCTNIVHNAVVLFLCHGLYAVLKANHPVGKGLSTDLNNWRANCKLNKAK